MSEIFMVRSGLTKKVNDKTTLEVTFDYEDGKNWNCQKGYYVSTTFMSIEDCGNGIVCKNYAPHTDCKTMCIKTVKRKSQKAMRSRLMMFWLAYKNTLVMTMRISVMIMALIFMMILRAVIISSHAKYGKRA